MTASFFFIQLFIPGDTIRPLGGINNLLMKRPANLHIAAPFWLWGIQWIKKEVFSVFNCLYLFCLMVFYRPWTDESELIILYRGSYEVHFYPFLLKKMYWVFHVSKWRRLKTAMERSGSEIVELLLSAIHSHNNQWINTTRQKTRQCKDRLMRKCLLNSPS